MRSRLVHITQRVESDEGKILLTKELIDYVIVNHDMVTRWAYILHDKDIKLDDNGEPILDDNNEPIIVKPHYHIVLQLRDGYPLDMIADWFNIEEQYVEANKNRGRNAFMYHALYLVHYRNPEKYQYNTCDVNCNFNYNELIDAYNNYEFTKKGAEAKKTRDLIRKKVMYEGMTLNEAREYNKDNYVSDFHYLEACRLEYLANAPLPSKRLNYYIHGEASSGKDLCSTALARALFPDIKHDRDLYFRVGADNVTFEGYEGQPVIIWSDCRANELLKKLGGRGNVFNVFDTFPQESGRQNVKYSSVRLINSVNIVNSVIPFKEFYLSLAGEYFYNGVLHKSEDVRQACRRFPFFISLRLEDFDIYMNSGFIDLVTGDFEQYMLFSRVRGSFRRLHEVCGENVEKIRVTEDKMLSKITEKSHQLMEPTKTNDDVDVSEYGSEIEVKDHKINFGHERKQSYAQMNIYDDDNPFVN